MAASGDDKAPEAAAAEEHLAGIKRLEAAQLHGELSGTPASDSDLHGELRRRYEREAGLHGKRKEIGRRSGVEWNVHLRCKLKRKEKREKYTKWVEIPRIKEFPS